MFDYFVNLFEAEKLPYAAALWFLSIVAPYETMIWSILFFIVFDMITGILAAKKLGKVLESRKLRNTVRKFGFSILCVYAASRIDMHMGLSGLLSLANGFCILIIGNEFYSTLENMAIINPENRIWHILTQFTLKKIQGATGEDISKK